MFLNLSKKQIKILIMVLLLVILIVIAFFLAKQRKKNVVLPIPEQNQVQEEQKIVTPQIENKVVVVTATEESRVESVSRNFAERLGSYSTDNKQENFISLNSYLSEDAKIALNSYISSNEKLNGTDYYGVSSKALNANVTLSGDSAISVVKVQQVERSGAGLKSNTVYKNLNLDLIKQGDKWLVTFFKWE